MNYSTPQDDAGNPHGPELNTFEKQLLELHLNRERIARWEKIIAYNDKKKGLRSRGIRLFAWCILGAAALFLLFTVWQNQQGPAPEKRHDAIAGLVDYPFMEQQVRGSAIDRSKNEAWQYAITLYRQKQYSQALESGKTLQNPFFNGMCSLQLGNFESALTYFDLALQAADCPSEVQYYQAVTLAKMGRQKEAKALFLQVQKKPDLREAWKNSIEEMLKTW